MPEYCITTKEIWYGYLYVEGSNIDEAIHHAQEGGGEQHDSDFGDTLGYINIRDIATDEETDLETSTIITDDSDPNNVFVKSKKQEEVDKAIAILRSPTAEPFDRITGALKILGDIKGI